jgi:hypothetical protein
MRWKRPLGLIASRRFQLANFSAKLEKEDARIIVTGVHVE